MLFTVSQGFKKNTTQDMAPEAQHTSKISVIFDSSEVFQGALVICGVSEVVVFLEV